MNIRFCRINVLRWLTLLVVTFFLIACASGPTRAFHSFGFDIRSSAPKIEVIDYRYGDSNFSVRAPEQAVKMGKPLYFNSVSGSMRVGEFLYVKWRIVDTGEVFEDTIDLLHRLPRNIDNQTVYFDIKGPQLYVYLISLERRSSDTQPNGPRMYDYRKVITIYPDKFN